MVVSRENNRLYNGSVRHDTFTKTPSFVLSNGLASTRQPPNAVERVAYDSVTWFLQRMIDMDDKQWKPTRQRLLPEHLTALILAVGDWVGRGGRRYQQWPW